MPAQLEARASRAAGVRTTPLRPVSTAIAEARSQRLETIRDTGASRLILHGMLPTSSTAAKASDLPRYRTAPCGTSLDGEPDGEATDDSRRGERGRGIGYHGLGCPEWEGPRRSGDADAGRGGGWAARSPGAATAGLLLPVGTDARTDEALSLDFYMRLASSAAATTFAHGRR